MSTARGPSFACHPRSHLHKPAANGIVRRLRLCDDAIVCDNLTTYRHLSTLAVDRNLYSGGVPIQPKPHQPVPCQNPPHMLP